MLDARYHLFYFTAIFLMLGFGILIGASYYGPVEMSRQREVVKRLAEQTNAVVQQRNLLQGRLNDDEQALASLRPALVRGTLAGKKVILIQTGDYADATEAANQSLGDAGATVAATVILTGHWGGLTARQRAALPSASEDPAAQDKALLTALAAALAQGTGPAITGASVPAGVPPNAPLIAALQQAGLLTVSGDLSQPCTLFVLVGGGSGDAPETSLDMALLAGWTSLTPPVTVAGCEPSGAASSFIPAYQSAGIATVDCVDLPLGQIALPFALRGEAGDYGIKPTAKKRLPETLEGGAP